MKIFSRFSIPWNKITLMTIMLFSATCLSAQIDYLEEQKVIERTCGWESKKDLKKKIHLLDSLAQYKVKKGDSEALYLYDQGMTNYKACFKFKEETYCNKATIFFKRSWKEYDNPHALWNLALLESITKKYASSMRHLEQYVEHYKDSIEINYEQVYNLHSSNTKALLDACKSQK